MRRTLSLSSRVLFARYRDFLDFPDIRARSDSPRTLAPANSFPDNHIGNATQALGLEFIPDELIESLKPEIKMYFLAFFKSVKQIFLPGHSSNIVADIVLPPSVKVRTSPQRVMSKVMDDSAK
jgi:hypothetical protein